MINEKPTKKEIEEALRFMGEHGRINPNGEILAKAYRAQAREIEALKKRVKAADALVIGCKERDLHT